MQKVILASASPWRRKIMEDAGMSFTIEKSGYGEDMTLKLAPAALAKRLALGKAMAVARRHDNALVIGADTFVVFRGNILGKPKTAPRAVAMLKELSGTTHTLLTGFAVVDSKTGIRRIKSVATEVTFHKLSPADIKKYVQTGEPLNVAGGYAIQGGGAGFVKSMRGDFNNVVGLPLVELAKVLKKFGVNHVRSSRGALNPALAQLVRHSSPRQAAGHSASNGVKVIHTPQKKHP